MALGGSEALAIWKLPKLSAPGGTESPPPTAVIDTESVSALLMMTSLVAETLSIRPSSNTCRQLPVIVNRVCSADAVKSVKLL